MVVLLLATACADSPPDVVGGRWRSWDLDRIEGANADEEIIRLRIKPTKSSNAGGRSFHKQLIVYCGTAYPLFEMNRSLGKSGEQITVWLQLDQDGQAYQEVWTVGRDTEYLHASPELLEEMRNRHLRLDITVAPSGGKPQSAIYSLANFEFLHAKHCKTTDRYQYVN